MIRRILSLIRLSIIEQRKAVAIAAGATFGGLLVIYLLNLVGGRSWDFHEGFFPMALTISGTIVTSLAFIDLHLPQKSQAYLMLPVSAAERVVERVLTTNLLFILAVSLAYGLFSLVAAGLGELLIGRSFGFYLPVSGEGLEAIKGYALIHAVFLFGAVYFRRRNLLKTLLSLAVLGMMFAFFTAFLAWIAFGDYREMAAAGLFSGMAIDDALVASQMTRLADLARTAGRVFRFSTYAITPALWVLTWLRLRETEVVHGV